MMNNQKKTFLKAYTLIELSISLMIISLIIAGIFSMATGSVVKSKKSSTNDKINKIYRALGIYLATNKRLPCPALLTESINDSANFGVESRPSSGECGGFSGSSSNLRYGMVPVRQLNLSSDYAIDDFGNKISYIIDKRYTGDFMTNIVKDASSFGTAPSTSLITIKERQLDGVSDIELSQLTVVVILSHGPNGFGSYNANDATSNPAPSDSFEANNHYSASYDNIFYSEALNSDDFDDILLFKSRTDFVNDFSMQSLIPCYSTGVTDVSFTPTSKYSGEYLYANSDCPGSFEVVPRKTLRCDSSGNWQWILQNCP
ncbi:MAG: hypothetical protein EBS92_03745 [Proteobacteria bacterium]|nr:hypothetical protein [Pseudomonadota bacterium]